MDIAGEIVVAVAAEKGVVVGSVGEFDGDTAEVFDEMRKQHGEGSCEIAESVDDDERSRGVAPDAVAHAIAAGVEGVRERLAIVACGGGREFSRRDGVWVHSIAEVMKLGPDRIDSPALFLEFQNTVVGVLQLLEHQVAEFADGCRVTDE